MPFIAIASSMESLRQKFTRETEDINLKFASYWHLPDGCRIPIFSLCENQEEIRLFTAKLKEHRIYYVFPLFG